MPENKVANRQLAKARQTVKIEIGGQIRRSESFNNL